MYAVWTPDAGVVLSGSGPGQYVTCMNFISDFRFILGNLVSFILHVTNHSSIV